MPSIFVLPEHLIDKIAAGEVVERPASLIKELIENAIDAGARQIHIQIENGGKSFISVADDGNGMSEADLVLSIRRHATSKIAAFEELFSLGTHGFRGEALAAIAAVSQFSIISKQENAENASVLKCQNQDISVSSTTRKTGTTVICRELFFNTPARAQFLKSDGAETQACKEIVLQLALSHPDVEMRLSQNDRDLIYVEKTHSDDLARNLNNRIGELFDKDFAKNLVAVKSESSYGSVMGFISRPGVEKSTGKDIYTLVNQRVIIDRNLRAAILRGYHSHLLPGRFPFVVLDIRVPPATLDVNVHPAKTQVRFQYTAEVNHLIVEAVRSGLRQGDWTNSVQAGNLTQIFANPATAQNTQASVFASAGSHSFQPPKIRIQTADFSQKAPAQIFDEFQENLPQSVSPTEIIDWQQAKILGDFAACYQFVSLSSDKLLVLDQHAFHERVLYERLVGQPDYFNKSQKLLIPEEIELDESIIEILMTKAAELKTFGFQFEKMPGNHLEIRNLPVILMNASLPKLFTDLALISNAEPSSSNAVHQIFSTFACHSAVRKGDHLTHEDWAQLFREASTVDFFHNCPHGRPVFKVFTQVEVARWFER